MHICFITSEYPKKGFPHGGVGTFVKTMGQKLSQLGHKVTVLGINVYTKTDVVEIDDKVNVIRIKPNVVKGLTWYFNNRAINKKIEEIHRSNHIDLVEVSELGLAFIKKIKSIKYIIRLHGGHHFFAEAENRKVSWWKGFQEKRSFKRADAFIAVSNYVKYHTGKFLSYHNKPIRIIMSPISLEVFKPQANVTVVPNTLLFAGTVCEKKGVHQLIKAMPLILKDNPSVELHIYGRDWYFRDGSSYISFLKEDIIPKLGNFAEHIHFKGVVPIEELAAKYAEAEICIFPSLMETQGLVAPEAMAVGKLVIFSECGPGPETVTHMETGLLCNPYNIDDIASKVNWAFKHKEKCNEIAENGQQFVRANLNIDTISDKNIEFYKYIINQ